MYGVVEIGGHQYRVAPGSLLDVEKLTAEEGSTVDFDQVLFIGGDKPLVGAPTISGAKITAKVIKHDRDRKILVFKRRPGLWQKKKGHRQHFTSLVITEVSDGQGNSAKIDKNSEEAKKFLS
jgi:large subunit ribosomal protein L21